MLNRIAAVAIVAFVLGGCTDTDWDRTLSYVGMGDRPSRETAPAMTTTAANAPSSAEADSAPRRDTWCDLAARSAEIEAREQGFDAATQRRQAEQALRQCLRP